MYFHPCGMVVALAVALNSSGAIKMDNQQADTDYSTLEDATWGKWLFRGVIVASLVFMWWLVIYPHGVAPHH